MKIVLARHCETDWNVAHRMQGHTDTVLNATGREQAELLGREMSRLGIERIFASNLKRAAETAEIISEIIKAPVELDERLREICFGRLEGKTYDEIKLMGLPLEIQHADNWDFRYFGGENAEDVLTRHFSFLRTIERRLFRTVLLIGHGSSFYTLETYLGVPAGLWRGSYQIIEYDGKAAKEIAWWPPRNQKT